METMAGWVKNAVAGLGLLFLLPTVSMANEPPTVATAASASPSPVTGATTLLSVLGADDGGEGGLRYTWETTGMSPVPVTFDWWNGGNEAKNIMATFTKAGNYSFRVIVRDSQNLAATSTVDVAVIQVPGGGMVLAATAVVLTNLTQQFTAVDQFGVALSASPALTWAVSGGGTISASGLFTASDTAGGPYTVAAYRDGWNHTANVSVTPGIADLMAHWKLDEGSGTTAVDSSGHGCNVTFDRYGLTWASGQLGNALRFSSGNAGFAHTNVAVNTSAGAHNTVAFWMYLDANCSDVVEPFKWGSPDYSLRYEWNHGYPALHGQLGIFTGTGFDAYGIRFNRWLVTSVPAEGFRGRWMHVAVVFPTGVLPSVADTKLYLDGVAQTLTAANVINVRSVSHTVVFGQTTEGEYLDDMRIYARELSASEVTELASMTDAPPTAAIAASASPNVVTGTTTLLSVLGADDGGEGNLTYTWEATGTPPAPVTFDFNANNEAKDAMATFARAGDYNFVVTIKDKKNQTVTSSVSVTVDPVMRVAVTPTSANINMGGTQAFTAQATDQFGEARTLSYTWAVSGGGSVNSSGLFTAGGAAGGPHTVTASSGGKGGTATVTVLDPANTAPTVATAASASPNPVTGTTTLLSVLGADAGGEANLTYTWETTGMPPTPVWFSANGNNAAKNVTATFTRAGSYDFRVIIRDSGFLTVTSSVSVTVNQTLTSVIATPASANVNVGGMQMFTATAKDQFGAVLASQPGFAWAVSGGGSISPIGLFTAGSAAGGPHTVTASSGGRSGTAGVRVIQPPTVATTALASQNPVMGQTTTLSVLGADDGGEGNLTYTWETTGTPPAAVTFSVNGCNAAKNVTATFTQAGNYNFRVTITDADSLAATSSVNVTVNQTVAGITVWPEVANVGVGASSQFTVSAVKDQFGDPLSTPPTYTWAVSGGGTINAAGLFTAGGAAGGPHTVTASSGGASGVASVTVTSGNNGLVGWWKLDDTSGTNALDSSGCGHNGTLANGPTWTSGKVGGAVSFNWHASPSQHIVAKNVAVNTASGTCNTATFWMKWNGYSYTTPFRLGYQNLKFYSGRFGLEAGYGANTIFGISPSGLSGRWVHVAAVLPNGVVPSTGNTKLYIDGVLQTLTGTPSFSRAASSTVYLADPDMDSFDGALDDARIYARELSAAEVAVLAGMTDQTPTVARAASASANPVTGTTANLSVLGADDGGEGNLTYTWETTGTPPAPVTFSVNGNNAAKNTTATFTKAGSYGFHVTLKDIGSRAVTSSVGVTVSQTIAGIAVTPASASVNVGSTQAFTADAMDQFGEEMVTPPIYAWAVSGGGSINSSGLFTAGGAVGGPYTVTASSGGKSGAATVTVLDPANTAPTVATAASASPNPVTGTTTSLSVLGADNGGEGNLTYTWETTGTPPAPVWFGGNGNNAAKNMTATFTGAGSYGFRVIVRDSGSLTVTSSVNVTVNPTLTSVAVTPASASVNAGAMRAFSATARDQFGAVLGSQPGFAWTVSGGGSINSSGLFTADNPAARGPHTVMATGGGKSGMGEAVVIQPPTVAGAISASSTPVTGTTTLLSVLAADDGGEANLTYAWETTGTTPAPVTFSDNGNNTAKNTMVRFTEAGSYNFMVTIVDADNLTVTSRLNVAVNQTVTGIRVEPAIATVMTNGTQAFTVALASDQFGNPLSTPPTYTWTLSGGGTINAAGLFTAGGAAGGPHTVTASSGGASGLAGVTVTSGGAGLVGWWKLDDASGTTAMDSSGYQHDGTSANAPTWTSGKVGGAVSFNWAASPKQYIVAENVGVNTASGTCNTVTFWMKWNGFNHTTPFLLGHQKLRFYSGWFGLEAGYSANTIFGISPSGLSGRWVHVAAVLSNGELPSAGNTKLYIDGVLQTLTGMPSFSQAASSTVYLAAPDDGFDGALDDVRIYARELSAAEVAAVMSPPAPDFDSDGIPDVDDPDDDNDGLPDVWETANGLNPLNAADAAQDADGDGMSNWEEYVAGTNPRDPQDRFQCSVFSVQGGAFRLGFQTVTGRKYGVAYKSNLFESVWHDLTNNVPGTGGQVDVSDPVDAAQRFYRITVKTE